MRVYQINVVCGSGSTGRMVVNLSKAITSNGGECRIAYGRESAPADVDSICISNKFDLYHHALMTRLTDKHGLYSKGATTRLIKDIKIYQPDIIHLHNIHGYYLNYEMLFEYLKQANTPVVWTLHDCWAFTGHCSHFEAEGCNQWKQGCKSCCQLKQYPACNTKGNVDFNYIKKRNSFTCLEKMLIITPSNWMKERIEQSFLSLYPVRVLYNAIDRDIFKYTDSDFRRKHHLEDRKIVLGVSSVWNERKGYDTMLRLAEKLPHKYQLVLVGLSVKQKRGLPLNIIGVEHTQNAHELAQIYSAADIYVNASKEESFGLTMIEAMACGTPVIVAKGTACEEIAKNVGGKVVENNVDAFLEAVLEQHERKELSSKYSFTQGAYAENMLEIYKSIRG